MLFSPARMHIPDGFLSLLVSILLWALAGAVLSLAIKRAGKDLGERHIPRMGVMAAFIFAAQMINFPVAGGTSGHLLGGALAAITLGPWAGMLVMTSVIIVQGLLFQDGGLLAMGANILNMGLLTVLVSYGLYFAAAGKSPRLRLGIAGASAWLSVMAAALATSLELWLSGAARLDLVVPSMLVVHALIGLGEALITVSALAFIFKAQPGLMESQRGERASSPAWVAAGVLLSSAVILLAPLASANPDGLERVAIDLGFIDRASSMPLGILPDYTIPFLGTTPTSTILAGAAGIAFILLIAILVMRLLRRAEPKSRADMSSPEHRA